MEANEMDSDALFKMLCEGVEHQEDVRETFLRAPFGWPGGKSKSYQQILNRLPYRDVYVEHCGGSGVIMLNRRPSDLEIFNDRDAGVTAFYRVIKDKEKLNRMAEWLSLTIHSREEFIWCKETWRDCDDDVERAARWYYMVRMSFGQQRRNFARAIKGKSQHPKAIYDILPLFPDIHARFANVQVENLDLFQSITDYDSEGTVHYLDPNYFGVSKGIYENEIQDHQHWELCERIMRGQGFFALSGYPNKVYDSFDWDEKITWQVTVTAEPQAFRGTNNKPEESVGRTEATECLYIRDNAP
jgi:DNA adenine methylase